MGAVTIALVLQLIFVTAIVWEYSKKVSTARAALGSLLMCDIFVVFAFASWIQPPAPLEIKQAETTTAPQKLVQSEARQLLEDGCTLTKVMFHSGEASFKYVRCGNAVAAPR